MSLPVWLYWEGELPQWIEQCRNTVFAHAPKVQLIGAESFKAIRDCDKDINLDSLCIAHRADFIRSYLLAKYGGLWVDSDCVVIHSLLPLLQLAQESDFIGYRERGGYVSNNFMAAKQNSKIANAYYKCVCAILRSGEKIEWLTLGSTALRATIKQCNIPWHELDVEKIQPICWSNPSAYFIKASDEEHEKRLNNTSYCYMLSANMVGGYMKQNPLECLLQENTFFSFLIRKSSDRSINAKLMNIAYRKNTDDDQWVIPEVIKSDMYRIKNSIARLEPDHPNYVIDCGAHIGAFSVMCSSYLKHAEIIAFEPNPESFNYLETNAANFRHIQPYQKAVDYTNSILNLYPPDQNEWSGRWTCFPNNNQPLQVESVSLFPFIRNLDKPVFIVKMDLEGYEETIINHATTEDLAYVQVLIVETHTDNFNHDKIKNSGFQLLFQPHISSARQYVYVRDN